MKYLLPILLFLSYPAAAQEDMPHPKTGEAGAWVPRWLQKDHLQLEIDLKSCTLEKENQQQRLEKKDKEIENRQAALNAEKEASLAVTQVLSAAEIELQKEKEQNNTLARWLWGTSSTAIVATAILVLVLL